MEFEVKAGSWLETLKKLIEERYKRCLWKQSLRRVLSQAKNLTLVEKDNVKAHFPHLLDNKDAFKDIEQYYLDNLNILSPFNGVNMNYTDPVLLTHRKGTNTLLYWANETLQKESPKVVIKCFPTYKPANAYETREFETHKSLSDLKLGVPHLYAPFETRFFRCYPMQMMDSTLEAILAKGDTLSLCQIAKLFLGISPILATMHDNLNLLYVDFSIGNIGFVGDRAHLFDFGSVLPRVSLLAPCRFSPRYASRNAVAGTRCFPSDDYEALGFVLLDAYYGMTGSPLTEFLKFDSAEVTVRTKEQVIDQVSEPSLETPEERFFRHYFSHLKTPSEITTAAEAIAAKLDLSP